MLAISDCPLDVLSPFLYPVLCSEMHWQASKPPVLLLGSDDQRLERGWGFTPWAPSGMSHMVGLCPLAETFCQRDASCDRGQLPLCPLGLMKISWQLSFSFPTQELLRSVIASLLSPQTFLLCSLFLNFPQLLSLSFFLSFSSARTLTEIVLYLNRSPSPISFLYLMLFYLHILQLYVILKFAYCFMHISPPDGEFHEYRDNSYLIRHSHSLALCIWLENLFVQWVNKQMNG